VAGGSGNSPWKNFVKSLRSSRKSKSVDQPKKKIPQLSKVRLSDYEDTSPMPPVIATVFAVLMAFILNYLGEFEPLGILLLAVLMGFCLMSLVWLEILTHPRFRTNEDMHWEYPSWGLITSLPIVAAIFILVFSALPSTNTTKFEWMMQGPGHIVNPLLPSYLLIFIISNLLLLDSMKDVKVASARFLRTPWIVPSTVSLISMFLIICYPDIYSGDHMILALFGTVVIASAAWIYGNGKRLSNREKILYMGLSPALGICMIIRPGSTFELSNEAAVWRFVVLPLLLNLACWMVPAASQFRSREFTQSGSPLLWTNILIIATTTTCIGYLAKGSGNIIIPLLPLLVAIPMFSREHTRRLGGELLDVERIHVRDRSRPRKMAKLEFSILGAKNTGKTSFAVALWTLLKHTPTRNIWWSKYLYLKDHDTLKNYADDEENTDLAKLGGHNGPNAYRKMIEDRIASTTCKELIATGKLPEPGNPNSNNPFPFVIKAYSPTDTDLDERMIGLVDKDNRSLAEATRYAEEMSLHLNFHGEAKVVSPSFFFKRPYFREPTLGEYDLEVEIKTYDISGESFKASVDYTRNAMAKPGTRRARLIGAELDSEILEEVPKGEEIDEQEIRTSRDLFLQARHAFYIADLPDLLGGDKNGVEKFMRLTEDLCRDQDRRMETLLILLNKADSILGPDDYPVLERWEQMNDKDLAEHILNDVTNYALDDLKRAGLNVLVTFTCSFGGEVSQTVKDKDTGKARMDKDGDGHKEHLAPYPMIPVNVLEPLIHVILSSRLHSEEV